MDGSSSAPTITTDTVYYAGWRPEIRGFKTKWTSGKGPTGEVYLWYTGSGYVLYSN